MNNALIIDATVPLPERNYTKDDLLLAAYLHDVDKLVCRYVADPEQPTQRQVDFARSLGIVLSSTESKKSALRKIKLKQAGQPIDPVKISSFIYNNEIPAFSAPAMVCRICYENGIKLSDQAMRAITYHEGGFTPGVQGNHLEFQPIAAVLHATDLLSVLGRTAPSDVVGQGRGALQVKSDKTQYHEEDQSFRHRKRGDPHGGRAAQPGLCILVGTDPLRPNAFLYYMPWGTELIDDGGTTVWTDSPDFAAVKARILRPTPLVKDLISQLRNTPGKSIVKLKVGDTEVPLTNVVIVGNTIVLS